MQIKSVSFVASYPSVDQCPNSDMPEFAFIGRSNVGKSSLINMLCHRKEIAKVSGTPGKTQLINFFLVNEKWHLVDLPGYGYAQISKSKRKEWRKMINNYLETRRQLVVAFVLLDSRIPLQKIDLDFINALGQRDIPFNIVFTKSDGLKPRELKKNIQSIQEGLLEHWESLPEQFITSSSKKRGREELLKYIGELINQI